MFKLDFTSNEAKNKNVSWPYSYSRNDQESNPKENLQKK